MTIRIPKPTNAETAILQVLWRRGASTVREVQETLDTDTGYTTTLKLLQIMSEKGLVTRDESQRAHVYRAAFTEEQTQTELISGLLAKAFRGSTGQLVMRALSTKKASAKELKEIRELIEQLGRKG